MTNVRFGSKRRLNALNVNVNVECLSNVNDAYLIHGEKISNCTHVGVCFAELNGACMKHDEKITGSGRGKRPN